MSISISGLRCSPFAPPWSDWEIVYAAPFCRGSRHVFLLRLPLPLFPDLFVWAFRVVFFSWLGHWETEE